MFLIISQSAAHQFDPIPKGVIDVHPLITFERLVGYDAVACVS
jgi:hypothetical protein